MRHALPSRVRSVFVSDLHLGTRNAKADYLRRFLARLDPERIVLVGDILDLWKLKGGLHWPEDHGTFLRDLLERARAGTEVIYIPGNHDGAMRRFAGMEVSGIRIAQQWTHETADGRRLLVMHGDELDPIVRRHSVKAILGDAIYDLLLWLDRVWDAWRDRQGRPEYWSLAATLKARSSEAEEAIRTFSEAAAAYARERGHHGVVCGHIHRSDLRMIAGTLYANCGDWVESNSALIEDEAGQLEVVQFDERCPETRTRRRRSASVKDEVTQLEELLGVARD